MVSDTICNTICNTAVTIHSAWNARACLNVVMLRCGFQVRLNERNPRWTGF